MGDRMDEAKGNIKEGAGKLTGDTEMEAEGHGEKSVARGKREIKGVGNQIKGGAERAVGKLTGDESTRAHGTADRAKGDIERTG